MECGRPEKCGRHASVWLTILLGFHWLCGGTLAATVFSSSLSTCQDQCVDRNIAVPLPKGNLTWEGLSFADCDLVCRVESCRTGCQDLDSLKNSTCDAKCSTVKSLESCQQGCRAVSDIFLHQIQDLLLNRVSAEVTLDVTQGVRLSWSFDAAFASTLQEIASANLRWVAQSRIGDGGRHGWRWTNLDAKAFKDGGLESVVFVPFEDCSEIQIRLAAIWRSTVVVSRTLSQVLLLPTDSTSSTALHHNFKLRQLPQAHLQLSANSYVVCWQSDQFREVHSALRFRLRLFSAGPEEHSMTNPISTHYTSGSCYLLRNLPLDNCCRVGVSVVIPEGMVSSEVVSHSTGSPELAGSSTESTIPTMTTTVANAMERTGEELLLNISLKSLKDAPTSEDVSFLLFTNGTSILHIENKNDFVLIREPTAIPFMALGDGLTITALASASQKDLLVGLSDGSIFALDVSPFIQMMSNSNDENSTTAQGAAVKIKEKDNVAITQLVVDHVQSKIYAVREKNGLVRCASLRSCENATAMMTSNSLNYIQTIAVDSNNGFLYYATNTGDTFSTPLFPVDSPPIYALSITRRLADIPPVATLEIDDSDQKLICALRNGSLFSRDLVDDSVVDERPGISQTDNYKAVVRSQFHMNRFYWITRGCGDSQPWASCLFGEERNSVKGTIHLNHYLYSGPVQEFVLMRDFQPPALTSPPSKIGLTMDDTTARLNWKPPTSLPFQASGSGWRALSYEYSFVFHPSEDSLFSPTINNATEATITPSSDPSPPNMVTTTTITTIPIMAGNVTSNVTDIFLNLLPNISGVYIAKVRACSWNVCSIAAKTTNRGLRTERFQKTIAFYARPSGGAKTADLAEGSGGAAPGVRYNVLDVLGREVPSDKLTSYPMMPMEADSTIAFDNSTGALYAASRKDISIFRLLESGIRYRFLDFLTINQLAVMASRSIIWMASSYSIVAYRLTSSYEKIIYNCVSEECGEVVGLAADDVSGLGRVFFFVQLSNGTVQLFSFNDVQPIPQLISSTNEFYAIRELAVVDDRLIFLTEDGQVGSYDLRLNSFNFNLALRDVAFLLAGDWTPPTNNNRLHFKGPIEFESNGELSWNVEPPVTGTGQILYKVQLYRDNFGGDRTVDVSQNNRYVIPKSVLSVWNSRQKFDVQVDAITAWTIFSANKTGVSAPTKPPSQPTNLKIYATQQKTVDGTRALIDLFWEEPREWNGDMLGYAVNCSLDEAAGSFIGGNISFKQSKAFSFSVKSGKIGCAVAATNEQNLIGAYSEQVKIDGSDFRPLIRLFAIDSTDSLVSIQNWTIPVSDNSSPKKARRQASSVQYQAIAFIGNELYAIRKESDSSQLFLVLLDINDISNLLYKGSLNGDFNGEIQAMTADWVANRLLLVANHDLLQISLDSMQQLSLINPKKLFTLSSGAQDAKQLMFDPFTNSAYLLTKNGSLFKLDLNKNTEDNLGLSLDCLKSQTVTAIVGEFIWNRAASPLIYALTWNGMIAIAVNPMPSSMPKCSDVNVNWNLFSSDKGLKAISSFTVADKLFIFFTSSELLIYDRNSALVSPVSIQNAGRTGALVEIQEPAILSANCQNISFPQTQFEVQFKKKDTDKVKIVLSPARITHVENGILDKDTNYEISVSWYNRYNPSQGMSEAKLQLKTGYGFPTAPLEPAAYALSPDTVLLNWKLPNNMNAPVNEIRFRITQLSSSLSSPVPIAVLGIENGEFASALAEKKELVSCLKNPCQVKVPNLRASAGYQFWVTALHINNLNAQLSEDADAVSVEAKAQTKDIPGNLRMDNATSGSIFLRWTWLNPSSSPTNLFVQYRQSGVDASWIELAGAINTTYDPVQNLPVTLVIEDLHSATNYDYRYKAEYMGVAIWLLLEEEALVEILIQEYAYDSLQQKISEQFYQQSQQGRTKAGTPTAPLDVTKVEDKDGWLLKWTPPKSDGGEPIQSYAVEFRPDSQSQWEIAERGLPAEKLSWRISNSQRNDDPSSPRATTDSEFRVRAANVEGFGSYASTGAHGDGEEMNRIPASSGIWLYIVLAFLLVFMAGCGFVLILGRSRKLKQMRKKAKIHQVISLENITNQIQFNNSADSFSPEVENEIRNLPYIPRSSVQVFTKKPLGKGSFGEVIEGIFKEPDPFNNSMNRSENKGIKVAVKYLKNDCDENRLKFLKEAVTMNNFDHPNIIKLLGVYRETQPHFLVFELMEGGDLHTFLNKSRLQRSENSSLSLRELVNMMIDVGRGASYLEAFKHGSSCSQLSHLIRNFSSASDKDWEMFTNDYYKVHGADFLPLRWLSPESAMQGIFTSKTDVWSFGIVMWEIMTLGVQPYPGINNMEVLIQLKEGKTLGRPHSECPEEIYEIMRSTWIIDPEKRPRFVDLLPKLEALRGKPHLQSLDSFPSSLNCFVNSGFDNSHDSLSGFTNQASNTSGSVRTVDGIEMGASSFVDSREAGSRFDKSENRSGRRHGKLPKALRQADFKVDRPTSATSAETMTTTLDYDYEIPRNRAGVSCCSTPSNNPTPSASMAEFLNEGFVGDSSIDSAVNPSDNNVPPSSFTTSSSGVPHTSNPRQPPPIPMERSFGSKQPSSSSSQPFATSTSSAPESQSKRKSRPMVSMV